MEDGNGAMDSVTGAPIMNVENWRISDFFFKLTKCSLIRYFVSNSFTDNCLLSELTTPIGNVGCPIHDHENVYLSENNHHQILLKHNWIFTKADKKGLQLGCLFFHWHFCYYYFFKSHNCSGDPKRFQLGRLFTE